MDDERIERLFAKVKSFALIFLVGGLVLVTIRAAANTMLGGSFETDAEREAVDRQDRRAALNTPTDEELALEAFEREQRAERARQQLAEREADAERERELEARRRQAREAAATREAEAERLRLEQERVENQRRAAELARERAAAEREAAELARQREREAAERQQAEAAARLAERQQRLDARTQITANGRRFEAGQPLFFDLQRGDTVTLPRRVHEPGTGRVLGVVTQAASRRLSRGPITNYIDLDVDHRVDQTDVVWRDEVSLAEMQQRYGANIEALMRFEITGAGRMVVMYLPEKEAERLLDTINNNRGVNIEDYAYPEFRR